MARDPVGSESVMATTTDVMGHDPEEGDGGVDHWPGEGYRPVPTNLS